MILKRRTIGKLRKEVDSDEESLFGETNLYFSLLVPIVLILILRTYNKVRTTWTEACSAGPRTARTGGSCSQTVTIDNFKTSISFRPTPGFTWPGKVKA